MVLLLVAASSAVACKKKTSPFDDSLANGRLRTIAKNLEEAYASAALPPVNEAESLADRLTKWDDFRNCTVRTYVARKRASDQAAREGRPRPSRHASIGDETIEECAVQMAIVNKDASLCERLAAEYPASAGQPALAPLRCWDTRARVLGLPDECPVVSLPGGVPGRNPECLALARRDMTICPFAGSPGRCRALITGDSASCEADDGAADCHVAMAYWRGLIPVSVEPPLYDQAKSEKTPIDVTIDLTWKDAARPRARVRGPTVAAGLSWPAGKAKPQYVEDDPKFWGPSLPPDAAQVAWRDGAPAVRFGFVPGGALRGTRALQPPGPTAQASLVMVWPEARDFWRCAPGPTSTGEVKYDAGDGKPGSMITGSLTARGLVCSDGNVLDVDLTFRLVILDVR